MPTEEWRPIPGWPYEASNRGRVRRSTPYRSTHVGRILRPKTDRYGYLCVRLCSGIQKDFPVHTLVLLAFVGPPPHPSMQTRHLDGVQTNNTPDNLAWGTPQENIDDRARHGRWHPPSAKLTAEQVTEMRALHLAATRGRSRAPRGTIPRLAARFNISAAQVENILYGVSWQSVGGST